MCVTFVQRFVWATRLLLLLYPASLLVLLNNIIVLLLGYNGNEYWTLYEWLCVIQLSTVGVTALVFTRFQIHGIEWRIALSSGLKSVWFYEQYVQKNSPAEKGWNSSSNTPKLPQPRPDLAMSMHRHTAHKDSKKLWIHSEICAAVVLIVTVKPCMLMKLCIIQRHPLPRVVPALICFPNLCQCLLEI